MQEAMTVLNPATMQPVPPDGDTIGEIMFRGNITMNGYLKNPTATDDAFAGGWLHTGDLAVIEPDGYVRIKDRSKDVIISGGENISSIEVEDVLHRHPAVDSAAVVAKPDEKWGEVPCAFIELRPKQQSRQRPKFASSAASRWRASKCPSSWCSVRSRRVPPARSRSSSCANSQGTDGDRIMTYVAPLDDMRFVLKHLAGLPEIATFAGFEEAEPELVEAILDRGRPFCRRSACAAERNRRPPGCFAGPTGKSPRRMVSRRRTGNSSRPAGTACRPVRTSAAKACRQLFPAPSPRCGNPPTWRFRSVRC